MKRLFAFMMALALMLSMSANVFAAGTGSITIANPTLGEDYMAFKIFDASYKPATDTTAKGVAYSIDPGTTLNPNPIFDLMFEYDAVTDTYKNDVFNYNSDSDAVTLKEGKGQTDIVNYLTNLIYVEKDVTQADGTVVKEKVVRDDLEAVAQKLDVTSTDPIVFDGLPYGYYLITSSLGTTVTINSNTPDVTVVDKNQEPNDSDDPFEKKVQAGTDAEGNPIWVEQNSAQVGDDVTYKISFGATNYYGDKLVEYYVIRDIKSSSLWVEFESIQVVVTDKKTGAEHVLDKGYYYCADNTIATQEWEYIGDGWGTIDPANKPSANEADWYLIHYGYDEFEIVIPWLDDYTFAGVQSAVKGYNLTFDLKTDDGNTTYSEPMYGSPAHVELRYDAAVGPDAFNTPANNSAYLDWVTTDGTFGPDDPEVTVTKTYNMGIIKTSQDGTRLEGATFELFSDEGCTQPVYVIPTNNEGVYVLDDFANDTTGENRITSRERYAGYWESYIPDADMANDVPGTPRNDMTTLANGQLIILGLEEGTYYVKETNPPVGYNPMTGAQQIVVGPNGGTSTENFPGYEALNGQDLTISAYTITVVNYQGTELPSTGGAGTVKMITIGTVIAIGFAVLLITNKKMTVYQD